MAEVVAEVVALVPHTLLAPELADWVAAVKVLWEPQVLQMDQPTQAAEQAAAVILQT
jgi:hypothetical protein